MIVNQFFERIVDVCVSNCTQLGRLFLSVDESDIEKKGDDDVEKKAEASKKDGRKDDGLTVEKKVPRRGSTQPLQRQVSTVWYFFISKKCHCYL